MIIYPLNKIDYNASDAELYNCPRKSGVYSGEDFRPSVTGADNIMHIGAGVGWIRNGRFAGKVVAQKENITLDMGLPDPNLPRIDVAAIQFSKNENGCKIVQKKGTPGSQPKMPAIVQTETVYELYICSVLRKPSALSVAQEDLTDLRLDPKVCGLMADAVTSVDTEAIGSQVTALISRLEQEIAGVEAGTEMMLKSVYDPRGRGQDIFAILGNVEGMHIVNEMPAEEQRLTNHIYFVKG